MRCSRALNACFTARVSPAVWGAPAGAAAACLGGRLCKRPPFTVISTGWRSCCAKIPTRSM
eukprot:3172637-Prymnesium_polylepis.1